MSLEYYLNIKNKYDLLIFSIDEITNIYQEMIDLANNEYSTDIDYKKESENIKNNIISDDIKNFIQMKEMYDLIKNKIVDDKIKIQNNIVLRCKHHFIEDTIDIDPDRCKVINYCQFCGITQ